MKQLLRKLYNRFLSPLLENSFFQIIFVPVLIGLSFIQVFFMPFLILIFEFIQHIKGSKDSFFEKYLFATTSMFSIAIYMLANSLLGLWYFLLVLDTLINKSLGFFGAVIVVLLPQFALLSTPFIILYKEGTMQFAWVLFLILIMFFHGLQSRLVFPYDREKDTQLDYLNHSPYLYILGAISTLVIQFFISSSSIFASFSSLIWVFAYIGVGLLFLSLLSLVIWTVIKIKQRSQFKNKDFYKPSVWILFSSYLFLKLLSSETIPSAIYLFDGVFILAVFYRIVIFMKNLVFKQLRPKRVFNSIEKI